MSKKKTTTTNTEDRMDTIVGIVTVLIIFAVFAALILVASARNTGKIEAQGDVRRGSEQIFTYDAEKVKKGDVVNWYVDNVRVATYRYDGEATLAYTPQKEGNLVVKVVAGKYNQSTVVEVKKPLLTISAKDVTMTYGDKMPCLEYECSGFLQGDSLESLNCKVQCITNCSGCGVYKITLDCDECEGYEVQCNDAVLTVLPKEIHVANNLLKIYDQTNVLSCPQIELEGVLEGDDVSAQADELYFENKNVGEQKVVTANIRLEGKDSANYVLCNELTGTILPKTLELEGLKIADKTYDGTTKAKIEKPGKLKGVIEGDSVAIGRLEVSFSNATVGEQSVLINELSLVGLDKDNYTVKNVNVKNARIYQAE